MAFFHRGREKIPLLFEILKKVVCFVLNFITKDIGATKLLGSYFEKYAFK